jgi:CBS domain-containing protein
MWCEVRPWSAGVGTTIKGHSVKTIREVMTQPVVAIGPDDTLAEAIQTLTRQHTGSLPVIDGEGRVIGMISELQMIDVAFDREIRSAPVYAYMSADVQVVEANEPLTRAAQLFALYSFRRLPVVEGGRLIGIVTRRDLMNYALRMDEVLADPLMELIPTLELHS